MTKRFKFNGATNCIEYDGKSILLDSYGEDIEELLNELHKENQYLKSLKWNQDCINEISIGMQQRRLLEKENEELRKQREELFIRERDTKNDWRELKQENEQLKKIIYEDESQIIMECSSHIQEDMEKLNKAYESDDINDLIRFCNRS